MCYMHWCMHFIYTFNNRMTRKGVIQKYSYVILTEGQDMAFKLIYNNHFPLRLINFAKKYLDEGGTIETDHKTFSQLSKLQVIDWFFPSLFIKVLPGTSEEASYNYETCYIYAPKKQGVLSNSGSYKQKINNLEDCLLGNSRNEGTYKNYSAAHSMLRRVSSDLLSQQPLFQKTIFHLQYIYDLHLNNDQKQNINNWLGKIIESCREEKTFQTCTEQRTDGLSFRQETYHDLIERTSSLFRNGNYRDCWTWLCLGSLLGNYIGEILNTYHEDFSWESVISSQVKGYHLISSPTVIANPFFCGRDNELKTIDRMFSEGKRIIFLQGIGGIGKTEIAKQYALQYQDQYDVIIFAFYESSIKNLIISDISFELQPSLSRLIINGIQEDDDAFFKRKLDIIRHISDQKILIIIDNFNTENDDDLYELISGRYRMLITTQYDYSHNYPSLKIGEIKDNHCLTDIFMNNYQGYAVEKNDPALLRLINSVNAHTYMIVLLAHHMEISGQTAEEMLDALNNDGILSLNEPIRNHSGKSDIEYQNLTRMFRLSGFNAEEQKVLQLLSLLPLSGTPPMVFKKWADLTTTRTLLNLERRAWIFRNPGGIALHPVIKKVAMFLLPVKTEELSYFLNGIADTTANKNSWHFTKAEKEQYSEIVMSIISSVSCLNQDTLLFYQSASVLLGYSGYSDQAVKLQKQLYEYSCENDGPYAFETARAAYRIGWTYLYNPQSKKALDYAEYWLEKSCELFEHNQMDTRDRQAMYCGVLENLSKLYSSFYETSQNQSDLLKAKQYAEKAVSHSTKWLSDYKGTKQSPAGNLLRLADVNITMKQYVQANILIDQAYSILSSMYDEDDPDVIRATARKAKVLYYLGEYQDSLELAEKNLSAYQKYYGYTNPSYLDQLILKVQNCLRLGYTEIAEKTKKAALLIAEEQFPADSEKIRYLKELNSEALNTES